MTCESEGLAERKNDNVHFILGKYFVYRIYNQVLLKKHFRCVLNEFL